MADCLRWVLGESDQCQDAQLFAEWGVDWLKEDHCNLPHDHNHTSTDGFYNEALGLMRDCLNATGESSRSDPINPSYAN